MIKSNFEEYVEYYAQHGTDPSKEEEVTPIVSSKEEEKKENSKISGTCHCDCAVFRYPACHCSWITEEANTGMERKTTGRMETKTGKSAGR